MTAKSRPWLIACTVGCVALVLIVGLLVVASGLFIRGFAQRVSELQETDDALEARYGAVTDFRPPADGGLAGERIEVFLRVREALAPARRELEQKLERLAAGGEQQSETGFFTLVRSGLGLLPGLLAYAEQRSAALLEAGMGRGEYTYIYAVAYYAWLEKSPADGPPFRLAGDDEDDDSGWRQDPFIVREERNERVRRRLNDRLLPMLRHQLEDLRTRAGSIDAAWEARLQAEIDAMQEQRFRLPWQDGVPERLAASLEAYRTRLEDAYSELCNPIESGTGP